MEECPYCLSPILDTEEVAKCRVCGAAYHAECLEESGGCALKDCEQRARPEPINIEVDADPHTVLLLTKEAVESAPAVAPRRESNPCFKCGARLPMGEIYCPGCEPLDEDGAITKSLWPLIMMIAMIGAIGLVAVWMAATLLTSEPSSTHTDDSPAAPWSTH